jgi:hypothetical protein
MLGKHTGAQLLRTLGDPPVDIRFGNDQYIQCSTVTPEPNRDLPIFTNPDVPGAVRTYYEHWSVWQIHRAYFHADGTFQRHQLLQLTSTHNKGRPGWE